MVSPMPFSLPVPKDFILKRDACSYGYFLLAPNHWDPRREVFSRVMTLAGGPALVEVSQPGKRGKPLSIKPSRALSPTEKTDVKRQLTRMLRLDEDEQVLRAFHGVDKRFAKTGRGRLFRSPTLFEDVIKTVTSCNVTWPNTVNMNRRLCEVLGEPVEHNGLTRYSFPTAEKLARARTQTLRARCRVGYRDQRIIELARLFSTPPGKGGLDQDWMQNPATPDDAIHDLLLELPGIGPYAAANIMQLLGRYARLPLDSESIRHGKTVMGMKGSDRKIMTAMHKHFSPFGAHAFRSYWFELWAYYETKAGKSWTWEKKKVGSTFTAAQLKA